MYSEFFSGKSNGTLQKVKDFFIQQSKWTADMMAKHESTDPYWKQVSYVMAQYSGLYSGYIHVAKNQPSWVILQYILQFLSNCENYKVSSFFVGRCIDLNRVGFVPEKTDFFLSGGKKWKKPEKTGKKMEKNWKKLKTLFSKGNIITKYNQMGAYNNVSIAVLL